MRSVIGQPLSPYQWLDSIQPVRTPQRTQLYRISKRAMDTLILFCALPILAPVLILCALLIKLDSPHDPIFFMQERTGKGGQRFRMYKFRTMVRNAEALKAQLAPVNDKGELAGPLKLDHDPRITRIGRILRKTSLDELPQVLNILKGEMSWVGPRPTSFSTRSYRLWHTERLDVLPGLTGLWQLYGRGSTDFDTWLHWDIRYIEKRCLWLDMLIILRTFLAVFAGHGAR